MNNARSKPQLFCGLSDVTPPDASGFTLLELLIVMTILALAAAAVVPGISASNQAGVDLVAEKVAAALRFTRSEAIRTGIAHGIILDHDDSEATGKDVVVYQLDTRGSPFGIDHVVYQPATRQPYDISVVEGTDGLQTLLSGSTPVFTFDGAGSSQHLHFDPMGRPVHYVNGEAHRLVNGIIQVGKDSYNRTVTLSLLNGQVSVQ